MISPICIYLSSPRKWYNPKDQRLFHIFNKCFYGTKGHPVISFILTSLIILGWNLWGPELAPNISKERNWGRWDKSVHELVNDWSWQWVHRVHWTVLSTFVYSGVCPRQNVWPTGFLSKPPLQSSTVSESSLLTATELWPPEEPAKQPRIGHLIRLPVWS